MASVAPGLRILGLDPGTRLVGWGVVEAHGSRTVCIGHGVLRARASESIDRRLAALAAGLREVLAAHRPQEAAIEEAFYGRDARAAQRLGEGRGALLLTLADAGVPVSHYANNVVKKAVTGSGRATKDHVQAMLSRMLALGAEPATLDASDALAIALCHNQRRGLPGEGGGVPPRLAEALRKAGGKLPRGRRR
jgi:crossover junction endodeoxyribonuclease RuvC